MSFDILCDLIVARKNPSVAGLDATLDYVPEFIRKKAFKEHGATLEGAAAAMLEFNRGLIDALCDIVPAVKPQAAYYELLGWQGMRALTQTIDYAKQKGMYVIADCKRGDIGSTAEAYARAFLGTTGVEGELFSPFGADSITVNGYLGSDGIKPFVSQADENEKSAFVLVKTSNPSSGELQDRRFEGGETLYEAMAGCINSWNGEKRGKHGFGLLGAVVGATYPRQQGEMREKMPDVFFLVPGYGAQGATAADIVQSFRPDGLGAIVNSSRAIMGAWKKEGCPERDFAQAARREAIRMRDELVEAVTRLWDNTVYE